MNDSGKLDKELGSTFDRSAFQPLPIGAVAGSCVLLFLRVTHFSAVAVICVVGVVYKGFLVSVVDGIGSLRGKSFSKHKRNQFCFQFRKYACCGWCS